MLFDPRRLLLIAGPCSLEGEEVCRAVAGALDALRREHPELLVVFKGSFDKANRTSLAGARGTGLEAGLALLAQVKREHGFPVSTGKPCSPMCTRPRRSRAWRRCAT
jgi:2-dehydro-3-deoxyphosphooctonate aldolase (KDO 8-P synthase)